MLVSAIFGGIPEQAVTRAFEEEVWVSDDVKGEISWLGEKLRSRLTLEQFLRWNRAMLPLVAKMRGARPRRRIRLSRDPKDDPYLSLALSVKANFLVTGDQDLLSLTRDELRRVGLGFLSIVSPREFLERIERRA